MVEQSGEPFLLPFLCCLPHTAQSLGHAFPALCRARVGLNDVLLGPRPSLPSLRRRVAPLCSAGSPVLRRSPTSPERACPPFGFWPSRTGLDPLATKTPRRSPGSRACCFSACAGSSTTRDRQSLAISAMAGVAFLTTGKGRHPDHRFSKLNSPAHRYLCLRFSRHLAMTAARLEARMDSLLLSCRALSSPTTCRFIPALYRVPRIFSHVLGHREVQVCGWGIGLWAGTVSRDESSDEPKFVPRGRARESPSGSKQFALVLCRASQSVLGSFSSMS